MTPMRNTKDEYRDLRFSQFKFLVTANSYTNPEHFISVYFIAINNLILIN